MSKTDIVNEIHKEARRNYPRRRVILKGLNDLWQSDLIEMIPHASVNRNHRYILVIINAFSKFAWALPIKRKTSKDVADAFEKVLKKTTPPKLIQTDHGKEYYGAEFQSLVKKYGIKHYSTYSHLKASIAERLNKTLKGLLYKKFSLNGNYNWIDILSEVVDRYNNNVHRTIRMKPKDVGQSDEKRLLSTVYALHRQYRRPSSSKILKIGDFVRVSKYKHVFEKSYTPNWSTEIFRIVGIRRKLFDPVTYRLEDLSSTPIKGSFYSTELQKTKYPNIYLVEKVIRKKGDQVYVKWLGFDEKSWVNKKDLL